MTRWTGPALALALAAVLPAQGAQDRQVFQTGGLNCILVESHERPLIRMELVCRWDPSELPADKAGTGGFLAGAMAAGGAGAYSRAAFYRALDALGMAYAFQARVGAFRWTLVADSRAQETAMERLTDAVVRPVFDGPLVETVRKEMLRAAAAETPRERGISRFLWRVGDPAVMIPPGAQGLDRIGFQDLLEFRRRVIRPEGATLVLYGDLNLAQARQLVLMHLGIWGPAAQAPVKAGAAAAEAAPDPRLLAVFGPGAAELWAGAPRPEASAPAVAALLPILLGRASRSLFGPFEMAFRLPPDGHSPLLIKAKVPPAERDALVPGFTAALATLRRTGFSQQDLARALIQWKAENGALALHPGALVRDLADGRLDPDLARAVDQVTLAQLDQALKAWLDPGRLRFLMLGADAAMLQAGEQAGMKPSTVLGSAP